MSKLAPMTLPPGTLPGAVTPPRIGLLGATGIGVGAIVGGGILALSGTAFALTGAGALLAFALNGLIAVITALSFAELATAFPRSGGPYVFARRVVSVGAAFGVGWVVWFASIVAAALYARGFAAFAVEALRHVIDPAWLGGPTQTALAVATTLVCGLLLIRASGGGGHAVNIGKVVVFAILILGGLWAWIADPPSTPRFTPLLPHGPLGLLQAMGATFIALQGFDLVAAVAGEVDAPRRTLPRAMLLALGIALLVYLPLLTVILAAGVADGGPGIAALARDNPDTIVALAAERMLGPAGYWLVVVAGLLSMASALLANVFAAARIAQAMGRDRALPVVLRRVHPVQGTPSVALLVTVGIGALTLLAISDVAAAGAASSLIFLIAFALAHVLCVVTRARKPDHDGFRVPGWPWVPLIGALACGGLAIYQAMAVPAAGAVTTVWLALGAGAYLLSFGRRARVFDAASEQADPDLLELRGRSPLVLVPVANPRNASTLARVATNLAPPRVGRILLFNVIRPPRLDESQSGPELDRALDDATRTMRDSLAATMRAGLRCEGLTTVGPDPWRAIRRAAVTHRCATVLMGLSDLASDEAVARIEALATALESNLVLLRALPEQGPASIRRLLVPIGGKGVHNALRARLLAGLHRDAGGRLEVTYLLVAPPSMSPARQAQLVRVHEELVRDEARQVPRVVRLVQSDDVVAAIVAEAAAHDLLVMGLTQTANDKRVIGRITRATVQATACPVMLVSARS
ncbi:MAG: amino acid permease [bacterium]